MFSHCIFKTSKILWKIHIVSLHLKCDDIFLSWIYQQYTCEIISKSGIHDLITSSKHYLKTHFKKKILIPYCFGLFWLAPIVEVHCYRQWGGATVVELSHGDDKMLSGEWWQHLESFHMFQGTTTTTLFLKVKLKHFILSIHDEPIVSCIFTKARFKSCDIKLAWLQPPLPLVQH